MPSRASSTRARTQPLGPTRSFGQPLLGTVGEVTAEIVKDSDGRYAAGDRAGISGLQRQYDATLAGTPAYEVVSSTGKVLLDATAVDGEDVHTTLDPDVQAAAEKALEGAGDTPAALVAVDVPTGGVLAAANSPSTGFDRALTGRYAPGSAFKIATTYAYLTGGVTTASARVACPPTVVVDGKSFRNYEGETLGNPTFGDDFAHSCNTAFIGLADRLGSTDLTDAAEALGVGSGWAKELGVEGTFDGSVPETSGATDQAAASIGQGRIEVSPVSLAVMVGSVARGSYVAPTLVLPDGETPDGRTVTPTAIDTRAAATIRATHATGRHRRDGDGHAGHPRRPGVGQDRDGGVRDAVTPADPRLVRRRPGRRRLRRPRRGGTQWRLGRRPHRQGVPHRPRRLTGIRLPLALLSPLFLVSAPSVARATISADTTAALFPVSAHPVARATIYADTPRPSPRTQRGRRWT